MQWSSAPYAKEGRVILGETLVDLADLSSVVAFARYIKYGQTHITDRITRQEIG